MTTQNYFELFQLPAQFDLDVDDLAQRHRTVITRVHPDQFAHKSAVEQRVALQIASLANQAHDTLKSPLKRAQYLLQLNAPELADTEARVQLPAEFLMQQMQWREALEEGKADEVTAEVQQLHEKIMAQLKNACDSQNWTQVKTVLAQAQFIENFMGQL